MDVAGQHQQRLYQSARLNRGRKAVVRYLMNQVNYRKRDGLRKYRRLRGAPKMKLMFPPNEPLDQQLKALKSMDIGNPRSVDLLDRLFALESIMFLLEKWGFEVVVASDKQFIEIIESNIQPF